MDKIVLVTLYSTWPPHQRYKLKDWLCNVSRSRHHEHQYSFALGLLSTHPYIPSCLSPSKHLHVTLKKLYTLNDLCPPPPLRPIFAQLHPHIAHDRVLAHPGSSHYKWRQDGPQSCRCHGRSDRQLDLLLDFVAIEQSFTGAAPYRGLQDAHMNLRSISLKRLGPMWLENTRLMTSKGACSRALWESLELWQSQTK